MKYIALALICSFLILQDMAVPAFADGSTLVQVDGTASSCVVNRPHDRERPGDAKEFPAPKFGYCEGLVQQNCATSHRICETCGLASVTRTCVGSFTSLEDRQAAALMAHEKRVDQQTAANRKDIKTLADAIDALTHRIEEMENRANLDPQK